MYAQRVASRTAETTEVDSLRASVARVARRQGRLSIRYGLPAEAGWLRCDDLLASEAELDRWRYRLGEWLLAEHGEAPARTVAGFLMSWYLYLPAFTGALLLHHERRVPSLDPAHLAYRLSGDRPYPDGAALLGRSFYCLPSDPAAGTPDATVVADERALAAVFRARYIAHAARFVRAFRPGSPLGHHTLWAGATDALDTSLWLAGREGGDEGAGVADAALVLASKFAPLTSASTLRMSGGEWTRRRESCCFNYVLPGQSECDSCPRICPRPNSTGSTAMR